MEEDIKILEDFKNNNFEGDKLERNEKGGFKIGTLYKTIELNPAIENLLARNKELEEYKRIAELTKISCCIAQNCEALNNAIKLGIENEKLEKMVDLMAQKVSHYILLEDGINTRPASTEEKIEYFKKKVRTSYE